MMSKALIVAANWKMNKTPEETMAFIKEFKSVFKPKMGRQILFFPSYLSLTVFKSEFAGTPVRFGAQNCYFQASGAFTGEVSAGMVKAIGSSHCLIGHSERRTIFKETNEEVGKKIKAVEEAGMIAVVCIGETLSERENKNTLHVIEEQLEAVFANHSPERELVLAYEPVWAIGTGKVATTAEIAEVHAFIRKKMVGKFAKHGENIPILYGGSVNPQNSKEIESVADVNGFLIGGASLKVPSLMEIY
jgi:triosephosphate isomerase (TIM)